MAAITVVCQLRMEVSIMFIQLGAYFGSEITMFAMVPWAPVSPDSVFFQILFALRCEIAVIAVKIALCNVNSQLLFRF